MTEKLPGFYGREAELAWLKHLWEEAATRDSKGAFGGPRLAMVIAETGLGKSRLVQELYQLLANDAVWNPPERSYWPRTIVSTTGKIHENPPLDDHVPLGPPRFLWLAARWQPIDDPNAEERTCKIPALRDSLYAHVGIAQRHRKIWERLRTSGEKKLKSEGPDYALGKLIDLTGIPFLGLFPNLIKAGLSLRNAPTSVSEAFQKQQEDAADLLLAEMHEVFGGLGGGGLVLPTVLWLDDAHWIDPMTLRFVHRLWKQATQKRWPLLIAITHSEHDWNKLRQEKTKGSLLDLATQTGAEKWLLTKAPVEDIEARLNQRLPGLLPAQRAAMLEKAAGNFLTLEENAGELIGNPENFVDMRVDGPLNEAGEDLVATWASKRQTRIHQRFSAMEPKPTLQQLLAWASRLGIRFPRDVPTDFATQRQNGTSPDPHKLLESCMDPYAVLGAPSSNLLEFRDRAYYTEATEYFQKHRARTDETGLLATLRDTLTGWINGAFDENGNVQSAADGATTGSGKNTDPFSSFGNEERRVVLEIALRELPLPPSPDWTDAHHRAALRSILLYLDSAGHDSLWPAVSKCAPRLRDMLWDDVPSTVVSTDFLFSIGEWLKRAAMNKEAVPLFEEILARRQKDPLRDPDWAIKMMDTLDALGGIHVWTGSYGAAEELTARSLQLAEQTFGPESLQLVAPLGWRGKVLINIGRHKEAEAILLRAQSICVRGSQDHALPPVGAVTLPELEALLGEVYLNTGRSPKAEVNLRRAIEKLEKQSDPHSLATALTFLGQALFNQGRPEEAEPLHRRALAILELAFGPESPNIGVALSWVALDLDKLGRTEDAIPLMMRQIQILERAYGSVHKEMAYALHNLAQMYSTQGDWTKASPLHHRALSVIEGLLGPDHPEVADFLENEAENLRTHGYFKEAEPLFLRAIAIREHSPGLPNQYLGFGYLGFACNNLGLLLEADGRPAEAGAWFEKAMKIMDPILAQVHPEITRQPLGPVFNTLGLLLQAEGRLAEAETYFKRATIFMAHDRGTGNPEVAQAFENMGLLQRAMGNNDKAEETLARAQGIRDAVKKRSSVPLPEPVAG